MISRRLTIVLAYLGELRTIVSGRPHSKDKLNSHTDLDTIAYWRDAFSTSQEENRSLRARIAELEGSNENYSHNSALKSRDRDQDTGSLRGKRKRHASNTRARSTRIAKQARIANTSSPMRSRHNDIHNASPAGRSPIHQHVTGKTPLPDTPGEQSSIAFKVTADTPSNRISSPYRCPPTTHI